MLIIPNYLLSVKDSPGITVQFGDRIALPNDAIKKSCDKCLNLGEPTYEVEPTGCVGIESFWSKRSETEPYV